jgi:hypothetical protein
VLDGVGKVEVQLVDLGCVIIEIQNLWCDYFSNKMQHAYNSSQNLVL